MKNHVEIPERDTYVSFEMILFAHVRMLLPTFDQMKEQILSTYCGFDFSKPEKPFSIYIHSSWNQKSANVHEFGFEIKNSREYNLKRHIDSVHDKRMLINC